MTAPEVWAELHSIAVPCRHCSRPIVEHTRRGWVHLEPARLGWNRCGGARGTEAAPTHDPDGQVQRLIALDQETDR